MDRRMFLGGLAGVALTALPMGEEPALQQDAYINVTLYNIATRLKMKGLIAHADVIPAKKPRKGVVQWRWGHYRTGLDRAYLPFLERINRELYHAMDDVHAMPEAEFDALMMEGLIQETYDAQITWYQQEHRRLIREQFTTTNPFIGNEIPPAEVTVDRELKIFKNLDRARHHIVTDNGWSEQVQVSPLTRLGAGYILSAVHGIPLDYAESAELDAKAAAAELSGDPVEYERWVKVERDKHFVNLIAESVRRFVHVQVGHEHDLTDDIARHNAECDDDVSHLTVTVPGVVAVEAFNKERRK